MSHKGFLVLSLLLLPGVIVVSGLQFREKRAQDSAVELDVIKSGSVLGPKLVGFWKVRGETCFIGENHGRLFLVDEFGATADLEVRGRTLSVPVWKNSGRVAPDYSSILWSDGTVWTFVAGFPDHYMLPYVEQGH
jgi:hypothetical protein